MSVTFVKLTEPEFEQWHKSAVRGYAADRMRAKDDEEGHSLERAESEFTSLLPYGLQTPGHYLYSVVDEGDGRKVGLIWLGEVPTRRDTMYIYDIEIHEDFRGRGYGTAALRLAEEKAQASGKRRMGLHVFGHNGQARELYEKLGYKATNIAMAKDLTVAEPHKID